MISIHALLLLLHLTQVTDFNNRNYYSIHILLLPSFWEDMATLANKTPTLFQYTAEVIHDNQWICHLAFCYFFFNGQIAYKTTSDLIWDYGKIAIVGNIGIDIIKSITTNWISPEEYKSYFANRFDEHFI